MNQTYKNLEILITDDCSKDNTYEILKKLAYEDSRIKLFKNENIDEHLTVFNEIKRTSNFWKINKKYRKSILLCHDY